MRIEARCDYCGRDFYFAQLAAARPDDADRCPHCGRHLGIPRLRPVVAAAETALGTLVGALRELAGHQPAFRIDAQSVLEPLREALAAWPASTSRVG